MKFEQLNVWKRSSVLACEVYKQLAKCRDFGFKDQITRSALSIPSNIAEGEERETPKESARFLYYAKGSAGELVTQLYIGIKIGIIDTKLGLELVNETKTIASMLGQMIKKRTGQPLKKKF
ncbi:four helix bundle protein [Thalassotalea psychrophila]|uniref:Four helix bundle protein n=1 Tax=Thalassotalea psychrophila TaxID=3065647 RepID=A0ABY9TQV8_9GAMM|nr:four helix bundle protein [Colwelliaceae bacterium SQ149]